MHLIRNQDYEIVNFWVYCGNNFVIFNAYI